jgi:hypothetical protein
MAFSQKNQSSKRKVLKMNALYKWYAFFASFFVMINSYANPQANHALLAAAEAGDVATMEEALKNGANINFQDDSLPNNIDGEAEGETPLILAVQSSNLEAVELLLTYPTLNVNGTNKHGWTPLMIAAQKGDSAAAELLISRGAYINVKTSRKESALGLACMGCYLETIAILLNGQDVEFSPDALINVFWLHDKRKNLTASRQILRNILYMVTAVDTLEEYNRFITTYLVHEAYLESLLNVPQKSELELGLQRVLALYRRAAFQTKSRVTSLRLQAGTLLAQEMTQAAYEEDVDPENPKRKRSEQTFTSRKK